MKALLLNSEKKGGKRSAIKLPKNLLVRRKENYKEVLIEGSSYKIPYEKNAV